MNVSEIQRLRAERDQVTKDLEAAKINAVREILQTTRESLEAIDLSPEEIAKAFAALAAPRQREKVAPKYRCTVSGKTWTGRGKTPVWFDRAEVGGRITELSA